MSNILSKARKSGVYTLAADWTRLGYMALAGGATGHYVTPWLLLVLAPFVVQEVYIALVKGAQVFALKDQVFALKDQIEARREAFSAGLEGLLKQEKKPE